MSYGFSFRWGAVRNSKSALLHIYQTLQHHSTKGQQGGGPHHSNVWHGIHDRQFKQREFHENTTLTYRMNCWRPHNQSKTLPSAETSASLELHPATSSHHRPREHKKRRHNHTFSHAVVSAILSSTQSAFSYDSSPSESQSAHDAPCLSFLLAVPSNSCAVPTGRNTSNPPGHRVTRTFLVLAGAPCRPRRGKRGEDSVFYDI